MATNKPEKVTGSACLSYIDKYIGLISEGGVVVDSSGHTNNYNPVFAPSGGDRYIIHGGIDYNCAITQIRHDGTRKIGLVLNEYADGGLHIAMLGTENIGAKIKIYYHLLDASFNKEYEHETPLSVNLVAKQPFSYYPTIASIVNNGTMGGLYSEGGAFSIAGFDELLDYNPLPLIENYPSAANAFMVEFPTGMTLTTDKNTTLHFGRGWNTSIKMYGDYMYNPIKYISGDLYDGVIYKKANDIATMCPHSFLDDTAFSNFRVELGETIASHNCVSVPFNLLLTHSETFANAYLTDGTLPPDAFLYPLDWDSLPSVSPDSDQPPDDYPNNNDPDDNERHITPNLPIVPTYTPSMLSNYNWYWLSVSDYESFINWFWNDIGAYSDFDDLIAKVEGLYNDVASAVLMVRFFPVEIGWIGGAGTSAPIKLGMIEKPGTVQTISQSTPPAVRDIGHIHIGRRYNSFVDMAPYTQLSLYLPFHGFIDLDIDVFMGHDIYVKAIYDYLTGTIQYLIYYDNQVLVNSVVAKLAVDIPITLQTKNDRDSSIMSNVSNTVGGLIGAGAGILSGNPIGMTLGVTQGVQAFNSATASAPLNVKGTVGESGALYSPPQCAIILRRPTIQASDAGSTLRTWKRNVGQLCGYGYNLNSLQGAGLTVCYDPRINFTNSVPLQSEVEEIYNYLKEGVIL